MVDRCCEIGKERAIDSPKFQCKMSASEVLLTPGGSIRSAAEALLSREPTFADQCELVLESCCIAVHRNRNCDSGKQLAKTGAACMDVELSKDATMATESFNDCCMSCSLGILAARSPGQNETANNGGNRLANRCKLISSLANSLSGQLYEQTYVECCQENLPRASSALLEPGAPVDCNQSNPCAQRCVSSTQGDSSGRHVTQDRCECFNGYRLAADGVNCVDIDECKLGQHTCNRRSEVCDNTRGGFRCLARNNARLPTAIHDGLEPVALASNANKAEPEFLSMRLCPLGSRWNGNQCEQSGESQLEGNANSRQQQQRSFSSSSSSYARSSAYRTTI